MHKLRLVSLAIGLLSTVAYSENIAIIDAGSSGSRLYFYQYQQSAQSDWPVIQQISSKKVKPGLSSFAGNPQGAVASIKNLIDYAHLPADEKHAPIYLMATAGMRLVSPLQQHDIYSAIKNYLQTDTQFEVKQVGTISGQWEGVYDWLAANYLNKTLAPGKTLGVLDMGGASTEIAYEAAESPNALTLNLGKATFNVDSKSFLGMGQDRAREQYTNDKNCYPVAYPLPNEEKGAGNAAQCSVDASALVNGVHFVGTKEGNIPAAMPFIAISGFYYTAKALNIVDTMTPVQLSSAANQFCSETWAQLQKEHAGDKYLPNYCFNAAYTEALVTQGYHFPLSKSIRLVNKINDTDVDWTLGAALYFITH